MKLIDRYYVRMDVYKKVAGRTTEKSVFGLGDVVAVETYYKPEKKPVGCVALYEDEESGKRVFGYSICSTQDNFNKKEAREVAEKRACNRLSRSESEWYTLTDEEICKFPREARTEVVKAIYALKGIV